MNSFFIMSKLVCHGILRAGAFKVSIQVPYRLVDGTFSPIYVDMRKVLGEPEVSNLINSVASYKLKCLGRNFNFIAGIELSGALFAKDLAKLVNCKYFAIRKEVKTHGSNDQIVGAIPGAGDRVLLVDDVITTGKSKDPALEIITKKGAEIDSCFVFVDRMKQNTDLSPLLKQVKLISLTDLNTLIETSYTLGCSSTADYGAVKDYLEDPQAWQTKYQSQNALRE